MCKRSIGTTFRSNTTATIFEELNYFINVTSISREAFYGSYIAKIGLNNVVSVQSAAFATSRIQFAWFPKVTEQDNGTSAANGVLYNCKRLVAIRYDAIRKLSSISYGSTAVYMVCTTPDVPTLSSTRVPSKVYVLDDLVPSYQATSNWSSLTIKAISQLPIDYPDCPWLDDLRQKGFIN